MSLIVHGRATSSNVQAVMWGAAEMGLAVQRRDLGGRFGGTDTPEFRAISPMGLVPALEDGPVRMFESAAILRHLVARHSDGPLRSDDPVTDSWAEWAKHTLCAAFAGPVFWGYWRTEEARRDMDRIRAGMRRFESLAAIAMNRRGDARWIMGDALTLADIWAGHILYRYFTLDLERHPPAGLEKYYAQLTDRPAYREHVMIDYAELKAGWQP